ncbi:serine O-acetyltransferase [Sphingobacterium sp. DK4209]|uniref:Serine acetyltransferase n=1 Tax=Sphingobacterium zhuxiongii TaxID=2662364 RepID=A0A5Q0QG25_9SPHI|nr:MULTISPECIES: DapH/DapD/GlmU-related protein [unclassified Sphingobacterium]MVZ65765.1 serine O-acetyltransferase [Sphingobacterium sp. DK4209]QGA27961.1 serine O-acetyltransferase [Sphingobacterium sp. dk4302]
MNVFQKLKCDYKQYKNSQRASSIAIFGFVIFNAGFRAVFLYRLGFYFRTKKLRLLAIVCEKIMHHLCNCWISTNAKIGEGFCIRHVGCIVIGGRVVVGRNFDIRQGVTLGGNSNKRDMDGNSQPIIGNNVLVGAGAKILGPVKIGDFCKIGANAVVITSFDGNSSIGGVPARLLNKK